MLLLSVFPTHLPLHFQDDIDEVTWQTYKGQLTEKQEKTREKVTKRIGKASDYIFIILPF